MTTELLICTNGHETNWPAIEYGALTASSIGMSVRLLGIAERMPAGRADGQQSLEDMFARAVKLFEEKGVEYAVDVQKGDAERVIPHEARLRDCIVVTGRLDRPALRRFFGGRSIRHLLADITAPVLYVPRACWPVRKMLVCSGGLGYEINAEQLAIRVGIASAAQMTLLHVAPPVDLDYPSARAERELWRGLDRSDSLSGRNLRRGLDVARAAGLNADIKARQGNVIEEILAELHQGHYDLVCMGSTYSGQGLRHLYGPSVTDEVAERAECPVLTARYAGSP